MFLEVAQGVQIAAERHRTAGFARSHVKRLLCEDGKVQMCACCIAGTATIADELSPLYRSALRNYLPREVAVERR